MFNVLAEWAARSRGVLSVAVLVAIAGCSTGNDNHSNRSANNPANNLAAHIYVTSGVSNTTGLVLQYNVYADGSMSAMQSPVAVAGRSPGAVVSDPVGRYVYVANPGDNTISQFTVASDGMLVPMLPEAVANPAGRVWLAQQSQSWGGADALAVSPSGHFLYVANTNDNSISQFAIGSDGKLSPLTPASIETTGPTTIAFDPSGQHAYVAGSIDPNKNNLSLTYVWPQASVSQFRVDSTGQLVPLNPADVAVSGTSANVVVDSAGKYAYVILNQVSNAVDGWSGVIAQHSIGTDGVLTPTGAVTKTDEYSVIHDLQIDHSGKYAFVLGNFWGIDAVSGILWQYTIDNAGLVAPNSPGKLGTGLYSLTSAMVNDALFILNRNATVVGSSITGGVITRYAMGSNGTLALANTLTISGITPNSMAVVPVR